MLTLTDEQFDALITRAMNELPQEYIEGLNNVAITYADDPDDDQRAKAHLDDHHMLLGLYQGIPLTQRGSGYSFVLPDKITLFKNSLLLVAQDDEDKLYQEIKRTLWHEMAHFYGLSHRDMDRRLSEEN